MKSSKSCFRIGKAPQSKASMHLYGRWLFFLALISSLIRKPFVAAETMIEAPSKQELLRWDAESIDRRTTASASEYEAQLYFHLEYVSNDTADLMESSDGSNPVVAHFCNSVQQQILGDVVANAMADLDASISIDETCTIVATSRLYDAEAVNIFGMDHTSLQVHVAQSVCVTANHFLWREEIVSIIESGFQRQTGGQSQFRMRLQENSFFSSVLAIELRRGLASPQEFPSPQPTTVPTARPTLSPTSAPSVLPTKAPSSEPTLSPTKQPSVVPSWIPTFRPSEFPIVSRHPSHGPSTKPTQHPSIHPSTEPTISHSTEPSGSSLLSNAMPTTVAPVVNPNDSLGTQAINGADGATYQRDTIIIAAVAGGMATLCMSSLFAICIWFRQKQETRDRRKPPKHALTSRDGQRKHDLNNLIPGIVELDHQSLADTTLGERTAGRGVRSKTPKKRPTPAIQPLTSFDEQSLYTTPFSVRPDEASSYLPAVSPTTSALSEQIIKPLDYEGNMLLPFSDTNTESSDGIYSSGPSSDRGQLSISEGPIDLDTHKRYDVEEGRTSGPIDLDTDEPYEFRNAKVSTPASNESLARQVSKDMEEGGLELDPYGMDEWSCDFEDFDRGSEFYADEGRSRSSSQSSKSTSRIRNISSVLGQPEEDSQISAWSGDEEKKEVEEEILDERESFAKIRFDDLEKEREAPQRSVAEDEVDEAAAKLYRNLMMGNRNQEKSTSPTSISSKKSFSSKKSTNSFSSLGSRKTQIGQPPLYPLVDSRLGPSNQGGSPDEKDSSFFPITLSKLFNAVASPDAKSTEGQENASRASDPTVDTKEEDDGSDLVGTRIKDDVSASSASTGMSPNPWLFDTVEQTLGPPSVTADMESLSGKSNLSVLSPTKRSVIGSESVTSHGSRKSRFARSDVSLTARSELEHDLKRLELQLAALDKMEPTTTTTGSLCASSITGASLSTVSTRNRSTKISRKKRIIVLVPPGKLGVILANRHDGKGTVISEVRETSSLRGMLSPGDKLVAVDGEDVTGMVVSQITSLMASKADRERRLTIITSVSQQYSKA